jgi:hypothetical protein
VVKKSKKMDKDAQKVKFIKTVSPGILAISYEDNCIDLVNINLETILRVDYSSKESQKYKGSENLKEALVNSQITKEIYMYLDQNDIDALLVFSVSSINEGLQVVYLRLKKSHQGTFEPVELVNDPKIQ